MARRLLSAIVMTMVLMVCALGGEFRAPAEYAPWSQLVAHGAFQIGTFTYLPAESGKVKPYELHNTSDSKTFLDQDIAVYFRESLLKELRYIGFKVDRGPVLGGEIVDYVHDDHVGLFDRVRRHPTTLTVHYVLRDEKGAVLYETSITVKTVDNVFQKSFEALARDEGFRKIVDLAGETAPMPPPQPEPDPDADPRLDKRPLYYIPSSAFVLGGSVRIGAFDYVPFKEGKVEADQIPNTAWVGKIQLYNPVAEYVSRAVFSELRFTGVEVEKAGRELSGSVLEIHADDLGSSSDWTIRIHYVVKDAAGTVLYDREIRTQVNTPKYIYYLHDAMQRNLESLMSDEDFLKAIGSPPGTGNVQKGPPPKEGEVVWTMFRPRTALIAHGALTVGAFSYPAAGPKLKPNIVANTAPLRTMRSDRAIAEAVRNQVVIDLRFSGIAMRNDDRILTGEIVRYDVDDFGDMATWHISIHFVVKDNAGAVLYDGVKNCTRQGGFTFEYIEVSKAVDALIADPQFIKVIN